MAGAPIPDGVVIVRGGKIERVGPASEVPVPAGMRVLQAKVVTPGLVDAHTVVGLSGYLNQPHDQDQIERSAPVQPELRAVDAYDPQERLVEWVRRFGVTTMHTGHGPGALISGQTMVVKTRGANVDAAAVVPVAMVAATLGDSARGADNKSPGNRAKMVAMLRGELVAAQEYAKKWEAPEKGKEPARSLKLDMLVRVLKKEVPLLVTAHRARDILSALRVAEEFGIRVVIDGGAEAYLVTDELKRAGVAVIVHPAMARSYGEAENLSMETASVLKAAGIPIALQSGFEGYVPKTRVLLFEAGVAAANGLGLQGALEASTIGAARILGLEARLGSLEAGKDGDLALFDGDPFEYTTHCVGTVSEGDVVHDGPDS
jgi:imidazolonepropionase-like amidohydrolase